MSDRGLPGAELARRFSADVAEPLLSRFMPGLPYAAARLGSGSDVLGLDDEMSRDHDWGCRLTPLVDARCPTPERAELARAACPIGSTTVRESGLVIWLRLPTGVPAHLNAPRLVGESRADPSVAYLSAPVP